MDILEILMWTGIIFFSLIALPSLIVVLMVMESMLVKFYKIISVNRDIAYRKAKDAIAFIWYIIGKVWHGYEIVGLENVPYNKPAMFICYHGTMPIDIYYFLAQMHLHKNQNIMLVSDRFMFKLPIPGVTEIWKAINVTTGTPEECLEALQKNQMVFILPGGTYEAQFGDADYKLMWKQRTGFAKIAQKAKVPIMPVFTKNIRETFMTTAFGMNLLKKIYVALRIPFIPVIGGFPTKLTTYIGKPIPYDESLTPEEVRDKVAIAVEDLIKKHQRLPGSIIMGLIERFYDTNKKVKNKCN